MVEIQWLKKSRKKNETWWHVPLIPAIQEAKAGGSWVHDQPGQSYQDSMSKIKYKQKGWEHGSSGRVPA
jgi:hypothetical protein